MPVSALQHGVTIGAYQNQFYEEEGKGNITPVINIGNDHSQNKQPDLPLVLTHVGNSSKTLPLLSGQLTLRDISTPACRDNEADIIFSQSALEGRKRTTAISVLKEVDGFTENSARELLTQYQFPVNSPYSDYNFALEVEQMGMIPEWAGRFKRRPCMDGSPEEVIETILLIKSDFPQGKIKFNLGDKLGKGGFGEVFLDADDKDFLIKKYFNKKYCSNRYINATEVATDEAEMFNRYYGEGAATVLLDEAGNVYVRMYKVPGQTLSSLPSSSLPADAVQRFVDMIEKLNKLEIIHNDLHSGNILWDQTAQVFYPVDINNLREIYFNSDSTDKFCMNENGEDDWSEILKEIEGRM
ncbi:serine/threonine protein kinase [Pectobacterium brasiliense]|uniref:serine/threonine protein kinase n=1 Tax=Pectobacterium brasiliense TaxID=180957 RepID=UPI001968F7C0|nr:serine/threonine protein kinase [Pectobacterium brasiliense]MBN3264392.1 serine/threonine protein kinase [Pectobacterium brasiliense]